MTNERVYKMAFSRVYPLLIQKAERKGRTKSEVYAAQNAGLHGIVNMTN